MKDKKAAKKIIKLAKKHPDWYTPEEVKYAKQVKWRIKQEEKEIKKKWIKNNIQKKNIGMVKCLMSYLKSILRSMVMITLLNIKIKT